MTIQEKATTYMLKAAVILKQSSLKGLYTEFSALQRSMALAMVHESIDAIKSLDRGHNPQHLEQVHMFIKENEFPYYPE